VFLLFLFVSMFCTNVCITGFTCVKLFVMLCFKPRFEFQDDEDVCCSVAVSCDHLSRSSQEWQQRQSTINKTFFVVRDKQIVYTLMFKVS